MNTAARDRALLPAVKDVLGRTPVSKLKLSKDKDGGLTVALHTSRPNNVRMESQALTDALKVKIGGDRTLKLEVIAEARAVAKYLRASPRKARLVIDVIKGKRVSEALAMLRFIPNHAAELISKVLISAAANAQDGWGAGVEELKVQNILADGGPSLKRVRARAQGRAFRILKRTSHLTVILTDAPPAIPKPRRVASAAKPKPIAVPAAPKSQTVTKQAEEEAALDAPITATPATETQQVPGSGQGEGSTGDSANTPESGQSATTSAASPEAPQEATPVTASDAPEIDMSDRAPDPSDGADQKREEGE